MYKIGAKFIAEGVWKDFNGCRLCIAQAGNKQFTRVLENLKSPFRKKISRGNFSEAKNQELIIEAVSQTILVDWDGVVDENDKAVPYDSKIVLNQLHSDSEMLEFVLDVASDGEHYRIADVSNVAKKS